MMSTQTQPAASDAGEPTVVVDDDKATALAGLAWSDDAEDYDEAFDDLRDRTTFWLRLYVGITAAVVAVLAVVLWSVLSEHQAVEEAPAAAAAPSAPDVIVPSSPPVAAPAPIPIPIPIPIPSEEPAPAPPPPAEQTNITQQQANTICGWLRDPSWTMPQIESSTGDMLANDNPSFTGTPAVLKAIAAAMSGTCPEVANQRPF